MKTTLDLPDDLMRRVKMRAVQRNQRLKDTVAELLERGMKSAESLPALQVPKPVRLKNRPVLNIEDIEAAISSGRE